VDVDRVAVTQRVASACRSPSTSSTSARRIGISEVKCTRRSWARAMTSLVEACRAAMPGEPFLYPAAVTALIRDFLDRASRGEATPEDPLTPRELEIVKLVAEGHSSDEIAELLVISKKTVEHHRSHVLEKLGMRDHVELTRYAIRRGLVEP
jgi:DNA-binding NarL/FixJ family response regulator